MVLWFYYNTALFFNLIFPIIKCWTNLTNTITYKALTVEKRSQETFKGGYMFTTETRSKTGVNNAERSWMAGEGSRKPV